MHSQILIIKPYDMQLDDIMYWYQEVDKTQAEKMSDERCQFFLTVPEKETYSLLNQIKTKLETKQKQTLEKIHYRSEHSLKEYEEKYNRTFDLGTMNYYTILCDELEEYEKVKNLPIDHPKQIQFIKENGYIYTDKWTDIYIKGKGYGTFHNPYELWDYYYVVNERRFPSDVSFLISKNGEKSNQMYLNELDVAKTIENIKKFTRVCEHIIFCEKNPAESKLYTINKIRFNDAWNNHLLVDNLHDVLVNLSEIPYSEHYNVTAVDFHW